MPEERAVRLTEMLNRVADKECRPFSSYMSPFPFSEFSFFSFKILPFANNTFHHALFKSILVTRLMNPLKSIWSRLLSV